MTRFARAKGSKAANERVPEDSTPWEVMKDQLLQAKKDSDDSKNRKEAEQKRIENYENFLKEQKVQKRKATWCDFPSNEQQVSNNEVAQHEKKKKKIKKNKTEQPEPHHVNIDASKKDNNTGKSFKKMQNTKKEVLKKSESDVVEQIEISAVISDQGNKIKKRKKQECMSNECMLNSETSKNDTVSNQVTNTLKSNQKKNKKNKNLIDGKPVRRKAINDNSFQLIINGREIELSRFDGFPVMKKDAERLQELKASMIKKGIPKSEVERNIKLERRRAEKALARIKKEVCYNCRKGGHILSDCPELKSIIPGAEGADGVCFKCGSTEHRQFECKVQRDKEFRFATCFICKEPGHIARQCPDNPKGLYPNGGSCKLCGDVTHLRKDCPTVMDKKEDSTVKLQTLDNGENIEDVGLQSNKFIPTEKSKKPKKIKF